MEVLVDTSVWSLVLRRTKKSLSREEKSLHAELTRLIVAGKAILVGPVRQELLSGVRDEISFNRLREHLSYFDDVVIETADYERAARIANSCAAGGVASTSTECLLCAVAIGRSFAVFTTDKDFTYYAGRCEIRLHVPTTPGN